MHHSYHMLPHSSITACITLKDHKEVCTEMCYDQNGLLSDQCWDLQSCRCYTVRKNTRFGQVFFLGMIQSILLSHHHPFKTRTAHPISLQPVYLFGSAYRIITLLMFPKTVLKSNKRIKIVPRNCSRLPFDLILSSEARGQIPLGVNSVETPLSLCNHFLCLLPTSMSRLSHSVSA